MSHAQKVSNTYKLNSARKIQPLRHIDKYDSISYNNRQQKQPYSFKDILEKELNKNSN